MQTLKLRLLNEGFFVDKINYEDFYPEKLLVEVPDLIIISVFSPEEKGIDLCTRLREKLTSLIFLVGNECTDGEKILGLSVGADQYITIPINISVLIAQINAWFRRCRLQTKSDNKVTKNDYFIDYPDLKIDLSSRTVIANNNVVSLTAIEFDILALLAGNPNRVFYTRQIFNNIWDTNSILLGDDKTVTVHISNLRKKIEVDPMRPRYIVTVRGIGYKFATPG